MRLLLSLVALLSLSAQADVTRTVAEIFPRTVSHSSASFEVTVPEGTDLLLICSSTRADTNITSATWNTSENATLIFDEESDSTSDAGISALGIVNPTATTANVVVTPTSSTAQAIYAAIGYSGVVASSVGDATNIVSSDENTNASTTTVLDSGGTSGNALVICASNQIETASPASNDGGFTEIYDTTTGGTGTDHSIYIAELLNGAPAGATITWGANEENIGVLIELVAASESSIAPLAHRYYEQVRQ